jgi:iron complex transport system substrate-binding protein
MQVVYVDLETPERFFRDLVTLGQLFGNETRAERIQSFYQSRLDRVDQSLRGLREEQKPRILILQYGQVGGEVAFNVPSASWIQTTQAESAGAIPVWKKAAQGTGWNVVNFEQIAAWNPDKLFIIDYRSDSTQIVEKLKTDPHWRVLKAVKEGQIFGFAADVFSWDQPDPRWILGLVWLAVKTHPDRFPDADIVQEIFEFFGQLYDMEEASITKHIMPSLKGDIK